MMISWVMPVNPSHPYLENDPAPSFALTICAFHLGFSLVPREGPAPRQKAAAPLPNASESQGRVTSTPPQGGQGPQIASHATVTYFDGRPGAFSQDV